MQLHLRACCLLLLSWSSLAFARIVHEDPRRGRQSAPQSAAGGASVDFSGAYDDPATGLKCVDDRLSVQTKEAEKLLECTHSLVNICHYTYATRFTSQRQDECKEHYEKVCSISFVQQARNETVEKCYQPKVMRCDEDGPGRGEVICKTVFESECSTRYVEKAPGKFVGDTRCKKLPVELCGRESCSFENGPEECHNKTIASLIDSPEETCDIVPQKSCRGVYKLVPHLVPEPECKDIPKEVCTFGVTGATIGEKPLVTKWCYDPKDGQPGVPGSSTSSGGGVDLRGGFRERDRNSRPSSVVVDNQVNLGRRPTIATPTERLPTAFPIPRPGSEPSRPIPSSPTPLDPTTTTFFPSTGTTPGGNRNQGSLRPDLAARGNSNNVNSGNRNSFSNSNFNSNNDNDVPATVIFAESTGSRNRPTPTQRPFTAFSSSSRRPNPTRAPSSSFSRPSSGQRETTRGSTTRFPSRTTSGSQRPFSSNRPSSSRPTTSNRNEPPRPSSTFSSTLLPADPTQFPSSEEIIGTEGPNGAPEIGGDVLYDYDDQDVESVTPPYSVEDAIDDDISNNNNNNFRPATTPATTPRNDLVFGTASADIQKNGQGFNGFNSIGGGRFDKDRGGRVVPGLESDKDSKSGLDDTGGKAGSVGGSSDINQLLGEGEDYYYYDGGDAGEEDADSIEYEYPEIDIPRLATTRAPSRTNSISRRPTSQRQPTRGNTQPSRNSQSNTFGARLPTSSGGSRQDSRNRGTTSTRPASQSGSLSSSRENNSQSNSVRSRPSSSSSSAFNRNRQRTPTTTRSRVNTNTRTPSRPGTSSFSTSRNRQNSSQRNNSNRARKPINNVPERPRSRPSSSSQENDDDSGEIVFHEELPDDLEPILEDVVDEERKNGLKVAKVVGGSGNKDRKADKGALAKVIKHNDNGDSGIAKTVIIKNTPEAFKVFGIKNVPKSFFEKTRQLVKDGARPLSPKPQAVSDILEQRERKRLNQGTRRPTAVEGEFVNLEVKTSSGIFRHDVDGKINSQEDRKSKAVGSNRSKTAPPKTFKDLINTPGAVAIGPIGIEETTSPRGLTGESNEFGNSNPFLRKDKSGSGGSTSGGFSSNNDDFGTSAVRNGNTVSSNGNGGQTSNSFNSGGNNVINSGGTVSSNGNGGFITNTNVNTNTNVGGTFSTNSNSNSFSSNTNGNSFTTNTNGNSFTTNSGNSFNVNSNGNSFSTNSNGNSFANNGNTNGNTVTIVNSNGNTNSNGNVVSTFNSNVNSNGNTFNSNVNVNNNNNFKPSSNIGFFNPTSQINPNLPLSSSGLGKDLAFLQQGRQPKSNDPVVSTVNTVSNNPAVTSVQSFAVPSNPPGPTKQQQLQQQLQISQKNTIRTHQSIIKPSNNVVNSNGNNGGFSNSNTGFSNSNTGFSNSNGGFSFPGENLGGDEQVRTSRNPDYSNLGAATASYSVNNNGNSNSNNVYDNASGNTHSSPSAAQLALFSPPATLQYGFKPLTTPTLPNPTAAPLTTQGRFSAPSSLMYGFSPVAGVTLPGASRPLTGGYTVVGTQTERIPVGPQLPSGGGSFSSYNDNAISGSSNSPGSFARAKRKPGNLTPAEPQQQQQQQQQLNNPGQQQHHRRRPRSMMQIISDMFEPITKMITGGTA